MNYSEIIKRLDESKYLISMTPVEKIIETGYSLGLNEKTTVLDLCCGYGEMLKIWCEAFHITGKGVDQCNEYISKGSSRLQQVNISEKIKLLAEDVRNYKDDTKYDVVCMSGVGDAFGGFEANIRLVEKFKKPDGKLVIGEAFANFKDTPKELIEFEGQLFTLHEIYQICRRLGYYITHMAGGNHNEWERYVFEGMSEKIPKLKRGSDKSFVEWTDHWFDMYFNFRREYEGWALFVLQ